MGVVHIISRSHRAIYTYVTKFLAIYIIIYKSIVKLYSSGYIKANSLCQISSSVHDKSFERIYKHNLATMCKIAIIRDNSDY